MDRGPAFNAACPPMLLFHGSSGNRFCSNIVRFSLTISNFFLLPVCLLMVQRCGISVSRILNIAWQLALPRMNPTFFFVHDDTCDIFGAPRAVGRWRRCEGNGDHPHGRLVCIIRLCDGHVQHGKLAWVHFRCMFLVGTVCRTSRSHAPVVVNLCRMKTDKIQLMQVEILYYRL